MRDIKVKRYGAVVAVICAERGALGHVIVRSDPKAVAEGKIKFLFAGVSSVAAARRLIEQSLVAR